MQTRRNATEFRGPVNAADALTCYQRAMALLRSQRLEEALAGFTRASAEQLADLPPGMTVEVLGAEFDGGPDAFVDTAAVMDNLDLVITCDTSVAHLAGALGRPTWLALKHIPEWRWFLDREDSPWYPAHRLFRQTRRGDWDSVFAALRAALLERNDG